MKKKLHMLEMWSLDFFGMSIQKRRKHCDNEKREVKIKLTNVEMWSLEVSVDHTKKRRSKQIRCDAFLKSEGTC